MPLTNNLKSLLDLPVWEWVRQTPHSNTLSSVLVTSKGGRHRFIYQMSNGDTSSGNMRLARYDTVTDGWSDTNSGLVQTLQTATVSNTNQFGSTMTTNWGHTFRALAASSSTVTGPFLSLQQLKGATIKILYGTGAGQERTITAVANPVVAARGTVSTFSTSGLTTQMWLRDTSKTWTVNQWAGYQLALLNSNAQAAPTTRTILYNDSNTLYFYDTAWASREALQWGQVAHSFMIPTRYQIESNVATVDSSWTVQPDFTSRFVCNTGTIFTLASDTLNSGTTSFRFYAYDVAADKWLMQQTIAGIQNSGGGLSLAALDQWGSPYATGTATGSSTSTVLASGGTPGWATNRWINYIVEITGGTGVGQRRMIDSSTSDSLTVVRPFSVTPDATSTYRIRADDDKIFFVSAASPKIHQFSIQSQMMLQSRQVDYGVVRAGSALRGSAEDPFEAFSLASITFSGTTATATTTINHNLRTGDSVTIAGATGANGTLYNGTFSITVTGITTFTYTMSGTPSANAVLASQTATALVDVTKNWTTNEHAGRVVVFTTAVGPDTSAIYATIMSNTATTLTLSGTLNSTAPTNGRTYTICDGQHFGFVNETNNSATHGSGVATSGTTGAVITDSTKNWVTNEHVGRILVFNSASSGSAALINDYAITANTATTITTSAGITFSVDQRYSILDMPSSNSRGTNNAAGAIQFAAYPSDGSGGRYMWLVRGYSLARLDLTTEQLEYLAISGYGPATGTRTAVNITYDGNDRIYALDTPSSSTGQLGYKLYYVDITTGKAYNYSAVPYPPATSSTIQGNRMEIIESADGLKYLYVTRQGGTEMFRTLLFT